MATSSAPIHHAHGSARSVREALPAELQHAVVRAADMVRDLRGRLREEPMATSVTALDRLLGGGLPRGSLVELVGRGSCGRFAALLAALATITGTGEAAALVDQGDQLDPQVALEAGLDLDRLLWLRPRNLPDTLAAAELLVSTGFPLVAVDLGLPPVRGRATSAAWLRLARGSVAHRAVVLVGSPYHLSGCAAAAVVTVGGGRSSWSGALGTPRLLRGLTARLEVVRWRGRRPHESSRVAFTLAEAAFEPVTEERPTTMEVEHVQVR
jgi:hypothetical protein